MRRRLPLAAAAVMLAGSCVTGGALLPTASADPCGAVHQYGHWSAVHLPTYPMPLDSGSDEAWYGATLYGSLLSNTGSGPWVQTTGYAADANNGKRRFATNGRAILRSTDGGCTWSLVFSIDPVNGPANTAQALLAGADYRVVSMAAASTSAGASTTIYAVIEDKEFESDAVSGWASPLPLYVLSSTDSGSSWQLNLPGINVSANVTPGGGGAGVTFGALAVSPQAPATAYLTMHFVSHSADGGSDLVYRTTDAGNSWDAPAVTGPTVPAGSLFNGAAVDPTDKNSVWVGACPGGTVSSGGNAQVAHSSDGGRTWQTALSAADPAGAKPAAGTPVSVIHRPGKPASVASWCAAGPAFLSTDGGKKFQKLTPPASPFSCPTAPQDSANKTPQFLGVVLRQSPGDLIAATQVFPCDGSFYNVPAFWRMSLDSRRWQQINGLGLYGRNQLPLIDGLRLGPLNGVSGIAQPFNGFGGTPKSLLIEYSGG
jgi:hypothetical protein